MAEAKLAPNLPGWMVDHANRYLSSGGTEGHMYKMTQPGRPEMTVPSLLLTTTGRKSGEKYVFPLFYGTAGDGYFVIASKGGAPQHPGWYRNILANPEVEVQVGTTKMRARARTATGDGARAAMGEVAGILAALRRLPAQDRARDSRRRAGSRQMSDWSKVTRPIPVPNEWTKPFWDAAKRGVLELQRCQSCGHFQHPPYATCVQCIAHRAEVRTGAR